MPDLIDTPTARDKEKRPAPRAGSRAVRNFLPAAHLVRFYARHELITAPLFFGALILICATGLYLILGGDSGGAAWDDYDESAIAALTPPSPGISGRSDLATATIFVEPEDALIYVDDSFSGIGPLQSIDLPFGTRLISIEHPGYTSVDTLIRISAAATHLLTFRLTPLRGDEPTEPARQDDRRQAQSEAGPDRPQSGEARRTEAALTATLLVSVDPEDADLFLDGRAIGRGSALLAEMQPGTFAVSSTREGYRAGSQLITLGPGDTRRLALTLTPERLPDGELEITVSPWGSIYIDGELAARDTDVRFVTTVRPGQRRVRATHPALGSTELTVDVRPGTTTSVNIDLVP